MSAEDDVEPIEHLVGLHSLPLRTLRRAVVVLVACFGVLATVMVAKPMPSGFERLVDRALREPRGSLVFGAGQLASFAGSARVVAALSLLLAIIVWTCTRRWRLAVLCLAGPAIAGVGEIVMKQLVGRTRPSSRSLTGAAGYGFPSGHTSGAAALAVVTVVVAWLLVSDRRIRRQIAGAAVLYTVAVGISRVVVGAHYAFDVVGGMLFGPAVALIAFLVIERRSPHDAWTVSARRRVQPPREISSARQ